MIKLPRGGDHSSKIDEHMKSLLSYVEIKKQLRWKKCALGSKLTLRALMKQSTRCLACIVKGFAVSSHPVESSYVQVRKETC